MATYGYLVMDFVFYKYQLEVLVSGQWRCIAKVWTDETSLKLHLEDVDGALISETELDTITCQDDISRTHPAAEEAIMREFVNTGAKD